VNQSNNNPPHAPKGKLSEDLNGRSGMAEASILMEGFLVKEGGSIKTWKKRWCVIQGNALSYYIKKVQLTDRQVTKKDLLTFMAGRSFERKYPNAHC